MIPRQELMKWIVTPVWFASIMLVVYLSLTPRIEIPYKFIGADKLGHCMAYAWLAALPFLGWERIGSAYTGALLMLPLSIGIEFLQRHVPGRDFSVLDMLANAVGVALGIIVAKHLIKSPFFRNVRFGFRKSAT